MLFANNRQKISHTVLIFAQNHSKTRSHHVHHQKRKGFRYDYKFPLLGACVIIKNTIPMLAKKISLCKSMHTDEDSDFLVRETPSPKVEGKKFRKWTETENFSYAQFLLENSEEFTSGNQRRSMNFFKRMSQAVDNDRSNEQCRSHHQKMLKRFGTVENIIKNFRQPEEPKEEKIEHEKNSSTA